jgi:hypothetical protein
MVGCEIELEKSFRGAVTLGMDQRLAADLPPHDAAVFVLHREAKQ